MEIKRIKWPLIFLFSVLIIGVSGYMLIEGWAFFDAFYMVVITLATVGYRETHTLSLEGRVFTVVLIIIWAATGFYSVRSIIQPIIEGGLRKVLGRRKLEKEIKKLKDHYIICGFGKMGSYVSRELQEKGVSYIVIEKDENLLDRLEQEN
ncbi:MAG: NAD-binding protein, partial [Proteobacteria bacterium]|nr:NAD-binding protein [Pseudomonadota bacterium]